jgi:hypothetical protein
MTTSGGQDSAGSETDPSASGVATSAGTLDGSGTSTGPSTTSATEATSTSDATGGSSSSGPGEESDSSSGGEPVQPGEGEPYGPCDRQGTCLDDNLCYEHQTFDMCLAPCGPGPVFACPEEPGGTAYGECIGAIGVYCMLNCMDGLVCPEGTTCEEVFAGIFRCLWP